MDWAVVSDLFSRNGNSPGNIPNDVSLRSPKVSLVSEHPQILEVGRGWDASLPIFDHFS